MTTTHELKRNLSTSKMLAATTAILALGLAACSDQKTPATPAAQADQPTQASIVIASTETPKPDDSMGNIEVDEEIARVCNLPTAHFPFDSANITGSAADALDTLANCLGEGTLKNRSLKLIGHADPRGTVEYNFALGQRRAGRVAEYLAGQGIAEQRLATTSMGELEATGTDKKSWARDRKVQILLGGKAVVVDEEQSPYSQLQK